jgi:serine/threonine protein kinase
MEETGQRALGMTGGMGTTFFMAPEVVMAGSYERVLGGMAHPYASDVYSYGIRAWCVLSGERCPYSTHPACAGMGAHQITRQIVHEGLRPQMPTSTPILYTRSGGDNDDANETTSNVGKYQDMDIQWPLEVCGLLERC